MPVPIRCESCAQELDILMFQVIFENGVFFNVCENCAPDGQTKYRVKVFNLRLLHERYEETST